MPRSHQLGSRRPSRARQEPSLLPPANAKPRRRKQPALVRRQILEFTAAQLVERGGTSLTLESVARAVGVSKGGLFHHFPSKGALLEALFDDLLQRLETKILALMAEDETSHGGFSRAYLKALVNLSPDEELGSVALLHLVLMKEPDLRPRLTEWTTRLFAQHTAQEPFAESQLLRYASDGLWLSLIIDARDAFPRERQATYERLLALTYPKVASEGG